MYQLKGDPSYLEYLNIIALSYIHPSLQIDISNACTSLNLAKVVI